MKKPAVHIKHDIMLHAEPDPDIDVQKETTTETLDKMSAASKASIVDLGVQHLAKKTRTANSPGKRKRSAQTTMSDSMARGNGSCLSTTN